MRSPPSPSPSYLNLAFGSVVTAMPVFRLLAGLA